MTLSLQSLTQKLTVPHITTTRFATTKTQILIIQNVQQICLIGKKLIQTLQLMRKLLSLEDYSQLPLFIRRDLETTQFVCQEK